MCVLHIKLCVHLVLVLRVERNLEQVRVGRAVLIHVTERLAELDHGDLGGVTNRCPCYHLIPPDSYREAKTNVPFAGTG